ncbi:MAG: thiamine pyrophosphate-dependent dehydrogenase E1 component subunit alpha [Bacteroidota bacterium]|nr:thiamine pyrophosphate-dependent dehydrogenase E1 component subunit alpha [Bacteroidota bacterium]
MELLVGAAAVESILEGLRRSYGLSDGRALAQQAGVSVAEVRRWRRSGRLPLAHLVERFPDAPWHQFVGENVLGLLVPRTLLPGWRPTPELPDESAPIPSLRTSSALTDEERRRLLEWMLWAREFDMAMIRLYRQGQVPGGVFAQIGNEAVAVGTAYAVRPTDALFPMHRDIGAHFVRGQDIRALVATHLGREGSLTRGTDGTVHYADPDRRLYGNISHLGAMLPVAVGYALAAQLKGEDVVVLTYIGDGGAQTGEFHEAVNFAAVWRLPVVIVIENNQYAYSTPNRLEYACTFLADRAIGYGCFGEVVDGTDVELVYDSCCRAVERARRGEGPTLLETITFRMRGHSEHDDASYVPEPIRRFWTARDPIERYLTFVHERGILTVEQTSELRACIRQQLKEIIEEILQRPYPSPEEAFRNVFL